MDGDRASSPNRHPTSSPARCNRGSGCLVGTCGHLADVRTCSCRAWTCDACARGRRAQVREQIQAGAPSALLTLTWDAKRPETPEEARLIIARAWNSLTARIRRRFTAQPLEFFAVAETTARGYPHLHIALRGPFMPQGWLSEQWADLVAAPVVDIRALRSPAWASKYLAKYLTKARDRLGTAKRYWRSRGWLDEDWAAQRRRASRWAWRWTRACLPEAVLELSKKHYYGQMDGNDRWVGWHVPTVFAPPQEAPP